MTFSLRFNVVKGGSLRPWSYHFLTPATPLQPRSDAAGYHAVSALGPDLMENAQNSVRDTIAWLGSRSRSRPGGRIHPVQLGGRPPHQPDRGPAELRGFLLYALERIQVNTHRFWGPGWSLRKKAVSAPAAY